MLTKRKNYEIVIFVIGCILLNYVGKIFANHFALPLWLDSIGTMFTAYVLGPVLPERSNATVCTNSRDAQ